MLVKKQILANRFIQPSFIYMFTSVPLLASRFKSGVRLYKLLGKIVVNYSENG